MVMETGPAVVLTREREDNRPLASILRSRGISVREIPCIETRYIEPESWPADSTDAVLFTSRRGVRGFIRLRNSVQVLDKHCADGRPLVGAVGQKTADELLAGGIPVDLIAEPPEARELVNLVKTRLPADSRIVAVCGNLGRGRVEVAVEQAGYELFRLEVYKNVAPEIPCLQPFPVAAIFIASPSAAKRLLACNPWMQSSRFFTIGPTTYSALAELGVEQIESIGTQLQTWIDRFIDSYQRAI